MNLSDAIIASFSRKFSTNLIFFLTFIYKVCYCWQLL